LKTLAACLLLLATADRVLADQPAGNNDPAHPAYYELWKPAIGGIIGAAAVPLWLLFWRWWTKPVLTVTVEEEGMILNVPLKDQSGADAGSWILARVCVRNNGRSRATNCHATLIKIEKVDGSTRTPVRYHDYLPLTWSNRDSKPIELGPHIPSNLDLCRLILPRSVANSDPIRFGLCFDPMPFVYKPLIDNDGGYWLHILLTADEAKPKRFSVRVDCNKAERKVSVDRNILESPT
jgi:hypothetical protein